MTTLYRLYDNAGALLYVGIAEHWPTRMKQHAREKAWWVDVVDIKLERHDDRASAEVAEREAIQAEWPLHNIVHASRRPDRQLRTVKELVVGTVVAGKKVFVGDVVALGLAAGGCPIGMVANVDHCDLTLDLYSFGTDTFGHLRVAAPYEQIRQVVHARRMTRANVKRRHGVYALMGPLPYDMDPLADFQRIWKTSRTPTRKP